MANVIDNKVIVAMAVDLYNGKVGEFSSDDMNATLRQSFIDICGTDKIDYKVMRRHGAQVFEILEEALDTLVGRKLETEFARFAEYRNLKWGDSLSFTLDNPALFKVAIITDGTGNLRRQRIDNGSFSVSTTMRGVKIYEEFYRFLAGRIDWAKLVNRIAESYSNEIYSLIYKALRDSYTKLNGTYYKTGSFDSAVLTELIQHVEASNNTSALIIGTKTALSKIAPSNLSDEMKNTFNKMGYYGEFNGTPMQEIKQVHINGTDTFAIDDSFVIVVPVGGEKLVKIVEEGDSIIQETAGGVTADMSLEYLFTRKAGIAVITAVKYGMYVMS